MAENIVTKSVVSVTEMARMVGLSRARFYQLVRRGTFPPAEQDPVSSRPCYHEEQQAKILEARRRNCGVDGVPILFYSRRRDLGQVKAPPRPKPVQGTNQHTDLIDRLAGIQVIATASQVESVLRQEFPKGIEGIDSGEVFRAVFQRLRRQNTSGSAE